MAIIKKSTSDVASPDGPMFRACMVALLAILAALLLSPAPARADESMRSFRATYEVQSDGSIRVVETITWDFDTLPNKHGIFRDLIVEAKCEDATNPNLGPDEVALIPCPAGHERVWTVSDIRVEAADEGGTFASEPFERSKEGDAARLKIGSADVVVSGVRVYRISYTLEGALTAFLEHDEFYWNATGRWPVSIEEAAIEVILPQGADARAACFQGDQDFDSDCGAEVSGGGSRILYTSVGIIPSGDELTLVAGWQKGIVTVPDPEYQKIPGIEDYFEGDAAEFGGAAAAGVLGFAGVGWLWWRNGRDRRYKTIYYLNEDDAEETRPLRGDPEVVVEYLPPGDLKPAQMGLILDERADPLDVTATIVDLAVRGYLHITEIPKDGMFGGRFKDQDWMLTKKGGDRALLLPYEREIFDGIFEDGSEVKLSDLKNKFMQHLKDSQDELYKDALERKWFPRNPSTAKGIWVAIGLGLTAVAAGIGFLFGVGVGRAGIGIPLVVAGLALTFLAPSMSRRTARGSEALRRVLGFRLYVSTAETHRQEFNEQENIFARYLPYAIVFGCVDKWAKAFEGLDNQVAGQIAAWYTGASAFHVASFTNNLHGLSSSVTSTVSSAPSSSGSGFSGGGAGGGGGGGGGGSW